MQITTVALALIVALGFAPQSYAQADRGYAAPVTGQTAMHQATARFQADLERLGVAADVQGCRLLEQVAVGNRNGEIAYGGACKIRIGGKPSAEFVICDSDLSGFGALYSGSFVDSQAWMEGFIRKNCW